MSHKEVLHKWIMAPYKLDREVAREQEEVVLSYYIDCHRNHCGPYTGAGELMRTIVPDAYQCRPDLVLSHAISILSVAPEMAPIIPTSNELARVFTLEKGIFYSHWRTLRLAHGLADFLLTYLSKENLYPCSISFENVQMADPLDQEFIAILLRRADPKLLSLTVCTISNHLSESLLSVLKVYAYIIQPQPMTMDEQKKELTTLGLSDTWENWLLQHVSGWRGEWMPWQLLVQEIDFCAIKPNVSSLDNCLHELVKKVSPALCCTLAKAYIESDCTSDNLLERIAYHHLEPTLRQQFHKDRAIVLEKSTQWSFSLGAIPYHYEHSDQGVQCLVSAYEYCTKSGYYEAGLDLAYRGRKLVNREKQCEQYWFFTRELIRCLLLLNRLTEAESLCNETQALTSDPLILMHCAYFMAILYARLYEKEQRDYVLAKKWVQKAIVLTEYLPEGDDKVFDINFLAKNTLALVEMHLGHPHDAIQLLSEGLKRLKEDAPSRYGNGAESETLLHNRARVYVGTSQLERAIEDYTTLLKQAPYNSEFYFDRGNVYRRLGQYQEALEDYNYAIAWSLPYPEIYYNRASLLSILGLHEKALADYTRVLELDPEFVDALLNRASLLYERGEYTESHKDVKHGLALDPDNAQLLCTLGLLEMIYQCPEEAFHAFSMALEHDPSLLAAWTNRAILAFEEGNIEAAIDDFTHGLSLQEDATVLYNRGLAYQFQERWQEAIDDYSHALALSNDNIQDILYQRDLCYRQQATEEHSK